MKIDFKNKKMWMVLASALLVLAVALFFILKPQEKEQGAYHVELIQNGDFSLLDDQNLPQNWYTESYVQAPYDTFFDLVKEEGKTYAHIKTTSENDARYAQHLDVDSDSLYKLSAKVKAQAEGGMGANFSVQDVYVFSNAVYDTQGEFEEVVLYGRTGENQRSLTVFLRVGGYSGLSKGEAFFTDVSVQKVDTVPQGFVAKDLYKIDTPPVIEEEKDQNVQNQNAVKESVLLLLSVLFYGALACFLLSKCMAKNQKDLSKKSTYISGFLVIVALFLVRVFVANIVPGYDVDMGCFTAWTNRMLDVHAPNFYSEDYFCDYPPFYLVILSFSGWIGRVLGTGVTPFMVKLPSIVFDTLSMGVLYAFSYAHTKNRKTSLCVSALYYLNPLPIISGAGWGQSDSAMTFFLILCVLFALQNKWKFALPMYMIAVLLKPQALMFGPVGLMAFVCQAYSVLKKDKEAKKALITDFLMGVLLLVVCFLAVVLPFSKNGISWIFKLYQNTMTSYAHVTVNALNIYYLFGLNWESVSATVPFLFPLLLSLLVSLPVFYVYFTEKKERKIKTIALVVGCVALTLGIVFAFLLPLFMTVTFDIIGKVAIFFTVSLTFALYLVKKDVQSVPFFGAVMLIVLFNMGTMMHERYLFPALSLLLMYFVFTKDKRVLYLFLLVTFSQVLNVGAVLYRNARIGGSAGHLHAPLFGILSDMQFVEILSAMINLLACMYSVYLLFVFSLKEVQYVHFDALKTEKEGKEKKGNIPSIQPSLLTYQEENNPRIYKKKLDIKDWVFMLSVTALYAVLAFSNLGSTKAPQTFYQFSNQDEQVVFDLGKNYQDFRMLYYGGIHYQDSDFTVEVSNDGQTYKDIYNAPMKEGGCFAWKYVNSYQAQNTLSLKGRYVRITAKVPNLTLFEVIFRDADLNVLPIQSVMSKAQQDVSALYDEQNSLEGEPSHLNSMYFDEIYHARTAYEHLHHMPTYEWTHPPLGKVLMSFCVSIFGMTPFGWRFAGTLCGVLMLPAIYLIGRLLFTKRRYALSAMLLLFFDTLHFAQTRMATVDSFVVLFILWSYYFMFVYFYDDFYNKPLYKTFVPLALSGLFMGLACASKWTGAYAGIGLAVIFFYSMYRRYSGALYMREKEADFYKKIKKRILYTLLSCFVFFVFVPLIIYYVSYIPHFASRGGVTLQGIIRETEGMFAYHAQDGLGMDHPFYSPFYQWPLSIKPMFYSADAYEPLGYASTIMAFGNIVIWWPALLSIFALCYVYVVRQARPVLYKQAYKVERSQVPFLLFISFLVQYLPWTLVPRGTYIYHYFPSVPFIILILMYMFEYMGNYFMNKTEEKAKLDRTLNVLLFTFVALCGVFFALYFPYASGVLAKIEYLDALNIFGKLFGGWLWY